MTKIRWIFDRHVSAVLVPEACIMFDANALTDTTYATYQALEYLLSLLVDAVVLLSCSHCFAVWVLSSGLRLHEAALLNYDVQSVLAHL